MLQFRCYYSGPASLQASQQACESLKLQVARDLLARTEERRAARPARQCRQARQAASKASAASAEASEHSGAPTPCAGCVACAQGRGRALRAG